MFYFQHPGAPRIRPTHAEEQREVWLELLMQDVAEATRFPYPGPFNPDMIPLDDEEEMQQFCDACEDGDFDPYHPDHGEG